MSTRSTRPAGPRASASTYPGGPEHVRRVRADVRRLLDGCPVADDVILCVSELGYQRRRLHSDSRRSGGTFTVRTESRPGAERPHRGRRRWQALDLSAPDPSHGRGLGIVRALADDWGITTTPAGQGRLGPHHLAEHPAATAWPSPEEAA